MKTKSEKPNGLRFGIVGAEGKMGQEILKILKSEKITAIAFDQKKQPSIKTVENLDVLIEFSSLAGFEKSLQACVTSKKPIVSGTTGFTERQNELLKKASLKIPILWSANMSFGVALLKKAIQLMASLEGFDYQIEEYHHNKKKDRPSGTAIFLQESLKSKLNKKQQDCLADPISIRAGGIIGTHKVYAVSDSEMLCFEHQAFSRKIFAEGALRAARWLVNQRPGLYKIEDIL